MKLPTFITDIKDFSLMQTKWKSVLDPVISNKSIQSIILTNVPLIIGNNVINHRLGRKLNGWRIIRLRSAASIYDLQDSNQTPILTLILVSNAAVVIDLEVF